MRIKVDDLASPEVVMLLEEHIKEMKGVSPPESKHALDLDGLRKPEVTFWTVWDDENLAGCGALKQLSDQHAEIKSMRTSTTHQKRGVASLLLRHIVSVAEQRGYSCLSLETGSMPYFKPARSLYEKYGFEYCQPFSNYKEDPNSVFMKKMLKMIGVV